MLYETTDLTFYNLSKERVYRKEGILKRQLVKWLRNIDGIKI